ncbi:UNVERIFIED_CONTAM: hypothetical protein PYX00_004435 [Menopon gallinae]|uniref:Asparagine synthetase [glutamine-hydrolyzing] n=1 Tax=Menopon gallinae TaxID=328185 RepID=A0AAW2I545_9NEOP
MCGIWLLCGMESHESLHCNDCFTKIAHRGPDAWRLEMDSRMQNIFLGFHRLSIVDGLYGMQPMQLHRYPHITLLCNGEIYNCERLRSQFDFQYETKCDVECIIHLYAKFGMEKTVQNLDGVFAFIIIDAEKKEIHIARDPYGVRPAFILNTSDGVLGVCSEAKGLISMGRELNGKNWKITPFPPGCWESYSVEKSGLVKLKNRLRFYEIGLSKPSFQVLVPWEDLNATDVKENIRRLFTAAVEKRLMSDRRIGCLLSGGLDSSLVAALLVKAAKKHNLPYKIQSFSIGMGTSPDLIAARQVAEYIGTEHHEVIFSEDDVAKLLDDVIYTLETPDITTIRASLGMYLLSRYIKDNTDTTVIFSGEGADELAQGYIYFRDAPNPKEAHDESVRLLRDIYLFDGLRADRTTAAHSLELRLPFLDQQFSSYYLSLSPESRQPVNGVEKHLLRDAFNGTNLIPDNILWRHKEAFSDGVASVSKSLFQVIGEIVDKIIPDSDFTKLASSYNCCTPKTKEALYYRMEFEKSFPNHCQQFMGYFWMPKWSEATDPSARFISHYKADK